MSSFKYSLTRICLRTGELTLPRAMISLFPSEGSVTAVDTESETEYKLTIRGPRKVAGLAPFFRAHRLDVNDSVLIRPLEDGRYAITAAQRPRRSDYRRPEVLAALLDAIYQAGTPLTEAEIRALYPDLPDDFDLAGALERDPRLTLHQGRWRPIDRVAKPESEAPASRARARDAAPDRSAGEQRQRRATVTPYPRGVIFPGDAGLLAEAGGDLAQQNRAREALTRFGFTVEGIAQGQLLAVAELGRRRYSALVHLLPDKGRLDWAALLARRRETNATYLAVFGNHRDLHRLDAPAELAQATLWSWDGIDRASDLTRTVLISPFDMEPHFQQGGLYGEGLERFERTIGERVAERGVFSAVLTRLATMRAPTIFMLEELAADQNIPREQLLRVLEQLSSAPFHLVSKVASGEFCLRYRVTDGLLHVSEYALSLLDRLPSRRHERLQGLPDDEAPGTASGTASGTAGTDTAPIAGENSVEANGTA